MSKSNLKDDRLSKKISRAEESKMHQTEVKKDKGKMFIGFIILIASVVAYYYFADLPEIVRIAIPSVGVALMVIIAFFWCDFGKNLLSFVRDSTQEVKKVVWPKRNDAMRMTFMVLVFVGVLALFIWFADQLISWVFYDLFLKR